MPPWRYSVTALWRWWAIAWKPICRNSAPIAAGSGAAYSMNSKPSVPIGLASWWVGAAGCSELLGMAITDGVEVNGGLSILDQRPGA